MSSAHSGRDPRTRPPWRRLSPAILLSGVVAAFALAYVLRPQRRPDLEAWFQRLPAADANTILASAASRRIALGGERRNAVLASPDTPAVGRFTVPPGAKMELAFGLTCGPPRVCRGGREFIARVRPASSGEEREVLRRLLTAPQATWQTEWIDLSAFAGEEVELELAAVNPRAPDGRLHQTPPPVAFWAEPLLARSQSERPNVVLISIDTLRADRLGCYGYDRPTSPALDRLAGEGVRFATAISQAPWTTPSHMSMLTSLYPSTHGVNQGWAQFRAWERGATYPVLPHDVVTLADVLQAHGYRTLAMTGGGTVDGSLGFAQGFDLYRQDSVSLKPAVWAQLDQWLSAFGATPFFLFFHTFQVHAPYTHLELATPPLTDAQRDGLRQFFSSWSDGSLIDALKRRLIQQGLYRKEITSAMYDGGIRYADALLGKWFDELRRSGLWDRTVVIVTSDHGEEFADHDPQRFYDAHCTTLYDELIHVPLIIRMPGRFDSGTVIAEQVEVIDIAPTILDLLGIPIPPGMQGRSLAKLMAGEPTVNARPAISEATCLGPEWKSLRTPAYKYVAAFTADDGNRSGACGPRAWELLFDLRDDPREQHSLHDTQPELIAQWRQQLGQHFAQVRAERATGGTGTEIGDDVKERLRALGYME